MARSCLEQPARGSSWMSPSVSISIVLTYSFLRQRLTLFLFIFRRCGLEQLNHLDGHWIRLRHRQRLSLLQEHRGRQHHLGLRRSHSRLLGHRRSRRHHRPQANPAHGFHPSNHLLLYHGIRLPRDRHQWPVCLLRPRSVLFQLRA